MDLMQLGAAFAVVAFAGFALFVMALRSRFQMLAAQIDADRNCLPHVRFERTRTSKRPRHVKAGRLARIGARHHRERGEGAFA